MTRRGVDLSPLGNVTWAAVGYQGFTSLPRRQARATVVFIVKIGASSESCC